MVHGTGQNNWRRLPCREAVESKSLYVVYLLMWRWVGQELANMQVEVESDREQPVGDDAGKAECARSSTV
jgi:hypothetical protein